MELSWKDFLRTVIKHWKVIVIIMLSSVAVTVILMQFLFTPNYEVQSKLVYRFGRDISSDNPSGVDLSKITIDPNIQKNLLSMYFAYLTSKSVYDSEIYPNMKQSMKKVISQKGYQYSDIIDMIKIKQDEVSYTITAVTKESDFGYELIKLYNTYGRQEALNSTTEEINAFGATVTYTLDVSVLDEPTFKEDSSGLLRSIIIGFLGGAIISAIVLVVLVFAASRIRSPKDLTKDLDFVVMGILPPSGRA